MTTDELAAYVIVFLMACGMVVVLIGWYRGSFK